MPDVICAVTSRYVGQQKEFEVELQYTSGILGYPDRENEEEDETLPTGEDGKKDGTGTGTGDGAGITAGSEGDAVSVSLGLLFLCTLV